MLKANPELTIHEVKAEGRWGNSVQPWITGIWERTPLGKGQRTGVRGRGETSYHIPQFPKAMSDRPLSSPTYSKKSPMLGIYCCTTPYPLTEAGWKRLTKDGRPHLLPSTKDSWETDIHPLSSYWRNSLIRPFVGTLCMDADCARPEPSHTFILAERWTLWSDNCATLLVGNSLPWNIVCLKRCSSQL